jgi:hypothetical protein
MHSTGQAKPPAVAEAMAGQAKIRKHEVVKVFGRGLTGSTRFI